MMVKKTSLDPLSGAAAKRIRSVARENWLYVTIGVTIVSIISIVALFVTRAIIRRRRRTFWQRVVDQLKSLGAQVERAAVQLKEFYDDNIDTDVVVKSVKKKAKKVAKELKS